MSANYLYVLATDLLDAASDALSQARTGHAAPSRQYVSHGAPAVDVCDGDATGQLTVHLDQPRGLVFPSLPTGRAPRTNLVLPVATYVVQLWRCVPGGAAPTDTVLDTSAQGLLIDAWCLWTGVQVEHFANTLFTSAGCGEVNFGGLLALPPQGLAAGWEFRVEVALNDSGP